MSTQWTPTALELQQAQVAVLADSFPDCYALFVHGSPIRDTQLDFNILHKAAVQLHEGMVGKIVINGLTEKTCREKNLAYAGYEPWLKILTNLVPTDDVVVLEASAHTGAESRNLLKLAKEKGWDRLAISSHPHHQLRCFLQIIALMPEVDYYPNVYNMPGPAIPWTMPIKKPVMAGTAFTQDIEGTLMDHIAAEHERLVMYAQEPPIENGKPKYTRHATIPEMLEYLKHRQ